MLVKRRADVPASSLVEPTSQVECMKIWLLTSEYPPMYGGGISTYCHETAVALAAYGHDITVITRADKGQGQSESVRENANLEIMRIPIVADAEVGGALGYWHLLSYCLSKTILTKIRYGGEVPDAIEVQDYGGLAYFLCKHKLLGVRELAQTPIVIYAHTPVFELFSINQEPSYLFPNYWIGQAEKFCLRAADAVICPSEFLRNRLAPYIEGRAELIRNPYKGFEDHEVSRLHDVDKTFDFVYVGRLEYRKGVLHMLSGFEAAWAGGHPLRICMIGSDTIWAPKQVSTRQYIENRYSRYIKKGLLTLCDAIAPDQLPQAMCSARAVIVPSIYENYPYVCIQAMNLGLPVVASSSGGQAEMVGTDGRCGTTFNWNEPGSFTHSIVGLAARPDQDIRMMGEKARARIQVECGVTGIIRQRLTHLRTLKSKSNAARRLTYPFNSHPKPPLERAATKPGAQGSTRCSGRITVVIPFYNLARYLPETIQSVGQSTYADIELIVVNDGSDDAESLELLDSLRVSRPDIRIIDIANSGLANARNVGAHAASGEFLTFLDADDVVLPQYFNRCISILSQYHNVSFVYSWLSYFENAEGTWVNFDTEFPYLLAANMLAAFLVVRTKDFLECGLNDRAMEYGLEDYEAWIRMVSRGKQGVSIPEPLVRYRVRSDSMARQFKRKTVLFMYEQMVKANSELYREWGDQLFMLINANGPGYLWNNGSISYPSIGYAHQTSDQVSESPQQSQVDGLEFSISELIRMKRLATRPIFSKMIKWVLKHRLDERFIRYL
jgi:glycogen(starch) synthase